MMPPFAQPRRVFGGSAVLEPPYPAQKNSTGADAPSPHAGVYEKGKRKEGRGLVPGKTKSDVKVAENREAEDAAVRRTHPPRSEVPRTTAKGVSAGRNRTLLFAAIVVLIVL